MSPYTGSGWYRDPLSCLHVTLAVLLERAGRDPLDALSRDFGFRWIPGDVRGEEFYWPVDEPDDPVAGMAPSAGIRSRWRTAAADPLAALASALAAGRPPIVAVDNFHLPFRPAYHDVHAAHLVVVTALDVAGGRAFVVDHMPPAHAGWLPVEHLLAAWGSVNPPDAQDDFFSGEPIERRWLEVDLGPGLAPLTAADAAASAVENCARFGPLLGAPAPSSGRADLHALAAAAVAAARDADGGALAEVYTFGWSMQAQAAVHGELLRRTGAAAGDLVLAAAGRKVEAVAHVWTGLRVTAAHGRLDPAAVAPAVGRHAARLVTAYETAFAALAGLAARARATRPEVTGPDGMVHPLQRVVETTGEPV
ncbi:Butirosin biosynthesis protein H, N-terminal [Jatrophihabitans endophyticus]|uniref:Butirosin biosynthesis protein H, N-terminal n=1 Tax=Jatrophihabitans endophyticus TaxID=1206085 RepID=A0A1M5CPU0_9ACTN|nr:BtrH N-terminal domain-containing protein [Jatrophihabitans endophyticus]SHF56716.1 Butirosin biosynthesis protein H, N-terminal [Jatrophihabitans endophyticus]